MSNQADVQRPEGPGARALALLERACEELRDGEDAIPSVEEALANLRAEAGELSGDEATQLGEMAEDEVTHDNTDSKEAPDAG